MTVDDITLEQTCGACPEQYNASVNGQFAGYLRLRGGYFYVEDSRGNRIYEAAPNGDGVFEWDERDFYLNAAKEAILKTL